MVMGCDSDSGEVWGVRHYFCLTLFDQFDNFAFTQDLSGICSTLDRILKGRFFAPVAQLDRATAF